MLLNKYPDNNFFFNLLNKIPYISFQKKILFSFFFLFVLITSALILSITVFYSLRSTTEKLIDDNLTSIYAAYNLEISLLNLKGLKGNYILEGDKKWLRQFDASQKEFNSWVAKAHSSARTEQEREILNSIESNFLKYISYHNKVISTYDRHEREKALNFLFGQSHSTFLEIYKSCDSFIEQNIQYINKKKVQTQQLYRKITLTFIVLIIIIFLCAVIFSLYIISSITEPLKEIENTGSNFIETFSAQLIQQPVNSSKKKTTNQFEDVLHTVNTMGETLRQNREKIIYIEKRAAISEITAGLSHEINNPMGVIYGCAELLSKDKQLSDENRELASDIFSSAQHCRRLIGELLNFSKSPEPVFEETELISLINGVVRGMLHLKQFSKVSFSVKTKLNKFYICTDHLQLRQALLNLLKNAAESVLEKPHPSKQVIVQLKKKERGIIISVIDNGVGIKPEAISKIYTPFYTTKKSGNGLGLSITSDIVLRLSGELAVTSNDLHTTFSIYLPHRNYIK